MSCCFIKQSQTPALNAIAQPKIAQLACVTHAARACFGISNAECAYSVVALLLMHRRIDCDAPPVPDILAALGRFLMDAQTLDLRHDEIQKILDDSIPSHGSGSTSAAGLASLRNGSNSSSAARQSLLGQQHHLANKSRSAALHDYSENYDSWLLGIVDDYKSELESVLGHMLKGLEDLAHDLSPYKCEAADFSPGGVEVRMLLGIQANAASRLPQHRKSIE